jgi:acetyl esterase/lipase
MTRRHFFPTVAAGVTGFSARRAQAQPAAAQTFRYKTAGCEIHADVYGASKGAAKPALLWMHGGALILGSRTGIMRPFQADLLEQG